MVCKEKLRIMANDKPGENPLPFFRERNRCAFVPMRDSVTEEDRELLGFEATPRYLPYKKLDRYNREKKVRELDAVVLENDCLRAVFLAGYGGRLISLYDKLLGRELLFRNPVLQTANLGILNAWFSGGIEWNVGQTGHTFTTCSPVFIAKLKDRRGEDFIRIYEYERCHGLFWQVDCHLPSGGRQLFAYVRIVNDSADEKPLYWWTNIAVPETEKLRIFSASDQVLYLDNDDNGYGRSRMPHLPVLPGRDASYPDLFQDASEYFFQTEEGTLRPWEAAVYPDYIFAECSSKALRYRKMFCWGSRNGGRRWQDYLSEPGKGGYMEIQAGLSRTQRHGSLIGPGRTSEFIQCFGGMENRGDYCRGDWEKERAALEDRINGWMPEAETEALLREYKEYAFAVPEEILFYGSGFGALEAERRRRNGKGEIPAGFVFPGDSLTEEQDPWMKLLTEGEYREQGDSEFPVSYCTGEDWARLLIKSAKTAGNWMHFYQLSVCYMEEGDDGRALQALERSLELKETAAAWRNMAVLREQRGDLAGAAGCYEKAAACCGSEDATPIYEEYFAFLRRTKHYEELFTEYSRLNESQKQEERLFLPAVYAALETGRLKFAEAAFGREYAHIRENAVDLYVIWNSYHRKLLESRKEGPVTDEEVKRRYPVPRELDFRMKDEG